MNWCWYRGYVAGASVVRFQRKAQLGSPIGRIRARFRTCGKYLPEIASTHVPLTFHPLSKLHPRSGEAFVVSAHNCACDSSSGKFSVFHTAGGSHWRHDGEPHFEVERLLRCFQMVVEKRLPELYLGWTEWREFHGSPPAWLSVFHRAELSCE